MNPAKRLMLLATVAAGAAGGCSDRGMPVEPSPNSHVVATVPEPTASRSADAAAGAAIAIEDALLRVIPGLDRGDEADALHDAFDGVADALESGDPKLDKLVTDAEASVAAIAADAPPDWGPDLDVLRLALGAVTTGEETGKGGPKKK